MLTTTVEHGTHTSTYHTPEPSGWLAHHDSAALRYMRERLYDYVAARRTQHDAPFSLLYLPEPDGRQHRVVLVNPAALLATAHLTFVAFFGHKRADIDAAMLDTLDHELIAEFRAYPHLLSYSSLELSDGSWANLVLMSSPEGITRWAESQRHAYAAREIAPQCYVSIRLHRGVLSNGIAPTGAVEVRRTKIFSFADQQALAGAARGC